MKRRLITLITIMSFLVAEAEHSHILTSALDSEQNYHITANSHIILDKGFKAEPKDGHEVLLDVDAFRLFPPSAGTTGGSSSNNTSGVVGTLGGTVDVNLLGGAIYTIPIDLPDGLGGMKPKISIYYNSQSKNGLLGWGWNLGGLSAITRTGGTLYHDGYVSAVNYTDDRFSLDGNRLMNVSTNNYGGHGTSYRTEQDQQSKITSYHETGINGPAYFEVRTADGNILYYGSTNDSKALKDAQNHVNIWLLSHIEDRNGNSITYHYVTESDSYRLDRIEYSGNSNDQILPAFSVEFLYSNRDDVELSAVGNLFCKMDKKLDKIKVYNGTALMYSYQFNYQTPEPNKGLPYHLLSSIKFFTDQEHFNPTRILWASNNYNAISGSDIKYPVTTNGQSDAFLNAVKFSGDFNGDGYTDVVALQPDGNGSYSTANLFVNRGLSPQPTFNFVRSFDLKSNASWIQAVDLNGDGLDDLLITNRKRSPFPFPDEIETEIYFSRISSPGSLGFYKQVTPLCFISRNAIETNLIGNFLGDGTNCFLVQSTFGIGKTVEQTQLFHYNETSGNIQLHQFNEILGDTRLFAGDFNGDGITEIFFKGSDKSTSIVKIIENNGTLHYEPLFNETLEDWNDCFTGDFNGDGVTDILLYTANAVHPWKIYLMKDAKISEVSYVLPDNFPYSSPGNYHFSLDQPHHSIQYLKIGDLDGNGCADLALYKDNIFYVFYGPLQEEGPNAPFTNCQKISTQAFGLYDNMCVCLGNFLGQERLSYLGHNTLSRLPSMRLRHEVKSITDGMGCKTNFTYDYLSPNPSNPSENDFYKLNYPGLDHFFNIFHIAIPMRGLKSVTTYNIKGKPVERRCFYEDALLHKYGKGFIGFNKTRQDDYCDGQLQKQTRQQYDIAYYNDLFHYALEQEEVWDHNGQLMARSSYVTDLFVNLRNNKVYIPLADKTSEEFEVDHPERLIKKEFIYTYVDRNCPQLHEYNEVLCVTSQVKGITAQANCNYAEACEHQEIINTTYRPNDYGSWLINRPDTVTSIIQHEGNDNIVHQQIFSYDNLKPHLVKSILDLPNDGSHPEDRLAKKTEYQYDPVGNISSKTISAPNDNVTPRQDSFEYSKTYGRRLLTKHTDALGQQSIYEYDSVYNYCSSTTDYNGLTTLYEQDPLGITCMTYYPDGTQSCKAVRWSGNAYSQWQKKSGQATVIKVFALTGDPVSERKIDLNGEMVQTTIEYDHLGRISKKSLPHTLNASPEYIVYHYDSHNRIDRITHPDHAYETLQYGTNQKSTTFYTTDGNTQNESKTFNVMGWTTQSTDAAGNNVIYSYRADGKPLSAQLEGHDETRMEMDYDGLGHRIMLNDPNYGASTYEYNIFDEVIRQTTPKMDENTFSYDVLGRMTRRTEADHQSGTQESTEWHYGTTKGLRGLLTDIVSPNHTVHYDYDPFLRLHQITETFDGKTYQTSYTYDLASRVASTCYPSNYIVCYDYTSEGYLRTVKNDEAGVLWKTLEANAGMQPLKYVTGDGFVTYHEYDKATQHLSAIRTLSNDKTIQNDVYHYDDFANMTKRVNLKQGTEELFEYDALNRLTHIDDPHGNSLFCYDELGRMISKTTPEGEVFSHADYSGEKPHAIKAVHTSHGVFPQDNLDIEYNTFDKVSSIESPGIDIRFDYGYDHQRIRMTENYQGFSRIKTYINGCEFINESGNDCVRTFISGPFGVFAVAETLQGQTKLHYIHKDHLGSWTIITDSNGNIEQEQPFDAWGCCKAPDQLMFDRGFTGHEHIRGVNLINMNGRLYDPVTSSMLSPDNNIQMPDFSQNLNRYAYCLNNPLSYTDPDGNSFIEAALMFYFLYCTDFGYEYQKQNNALAFHIDLHLSKQQLGLGFDISLGVPKKYNVSYRAHVGATYYLNFYDNSYTGLEFRAGSEWCAFGMIGYSGTTFIQGRKYQTTNSVILGSYLCNFTYENDYMFNIGKYIPFVLASDNGDRYRTAAARFRFGILSVGVNIFTGDPGIDLDTRQTFNDPDADGRETYTISTNGDNPDEYRAGVLYVGLGPIRIGANSEQIRHFFQNRFAHDFLCHGDTPYFKVLDRPKQTYFYFGTETGSTLW